MKIILPFSEFLSESIADKEIHKAVFMIGGAGAGKTTAAKRMFGGRLKMVNSDEFTKFLLKREGLSLVFDKSKEEEYKKKLAIREVAKDLESGRLSHLIDGLHSIVLDGTGKNAPKLRRQYDALYGLGYDCYMVFVNTSLEEAKKRNANRERKVAPDVVERMWHELEDNIEDYKKLFGDKFFEYNSGEDGVDVVDEIGKDILHNGLDNPVGKAIRMLMADQGVKYLHELDSEQVAALRKKVNLR